MTRFKTFVLALLAVFCMSVVAAATASADEGTFVNKNGVTLTKNKFKGTSGVTKLQAVGGGFITCTLDTVEGVVTSKTEGEQTVRFTECKQSTGSTCKGGTGAGAKEIIILLSFRLRRASQPSGAILLLLSILPSRYENGEFDIKCGTVDVKVLGSFLTPVGAAQEKVLRTLFLFTAKQASGVQNPIEFENEAKEKIKDTLKAKIGSGGALEQAGEEGSEDVVFEEAGEFK